MSTDTKTGARNQRTNSDTLAVITHSHTFRALTFMGEWFYKPKWVLKYRVSTYRDQNYICHSVIT